METREFASNKRPDRFGSLFLVVSRLFCALALVSAFGLPEAEAQKGPSCPLSDTQTRKSIDAFAKVAGFITHEPRCVNCHGGVNPYMDGTGLDPDNAAAAPSIVEHAPGKQFHEKKGEIDIECTNQCHSAMAPRTDGSKSRWFLAADFHSFVDKDDTTLCKQIKQSTGSAKEFIAHLTDDSGKDNFVATAFNGDRGLSKEARDDYHVVIRKPSFQGKELSKLDFVKLGQDWVDAMGGSFKGDPSCGCESKHYKWSGQIHYIFESKGDEEENELQTWSGYDAVTVTVTLTDGAGTARTHAVASGMSENRQKVFPSGFRKDTSSRTEAAADGTAPATVEVQFDDRTGTYRVSPRWSPPGAKGKQRYDSCIREDCKSKESDYFADVPMDTQISDKVTDPNHLSGSKRDIRTGLGRSKKGVMIRSVAWDLSRSEP